MKRSSAVPSQKLTRRYEHVENYTDLPEITLRQIEHFFTHYKDLEPGKWVKIGRWGDADEARSLVLAAIEAGQGGGEVIRQALRLSRKAACSASRFQMPQGASNGIGAPCRSRATPRSMLAPISCTSAMKSRIVQK